MLALGESLWTPPPWSTTLHYVFHRPESVRVFTEVNRFAEMRATRYFFYELWESRLYTPAELNWEKGEDKSTYSWLLILSKAICNEWCLQSVLHRFTILHWFTIIVRNLDVGVLENVFISIQTSPLTVTLVTVTPRLQWQFYQVPNGLSYIKDGVVRVTLAYSDTFLLSQGCHCKRGRL